MTSRVKTGLALIAIGVAAWLIGAAGGEVTSSATGGGLLLILLGLGFTAVGLVRD